MAASENAAVPFICLFVCEQDNSKYYGWIFVKFGN